MTKIGELVKKFESQIVNYPTYNLAYRTILRSIQATQMRGVASCVTLMAPSGCGKSTLCHQISDSFEPASTVESEQGVSNKRGTVYCSLPSKATIKSFAKELVRALDISDPTGEAHDLIHIAITQIKLQQIQIVFLDEFQVLANKKAEQARENICRCISQLVDNTGVPFVVAGTPEIEMLFYSLDVLIRRFPFCAKLAPLKFDIDNMNSDFQIVLQALDRKMYEIGELSSGVHLHEPSIALPLYAMCSGNLEALRLEISNAFFSALHRGTHTILRSDFEDAFEITRQDRCLLEEGNPFQMPYKVLWDEVHANLGKVDKKNAN